MSHPAGRSHLSQAFRSPLLQQLVAQSLTNVNRDRRIEELSDSTSEFSLSLSISPSCSANRQQNEETFSQTPSYVSPVPQYKVSSTLRSKQKNDGLSSPLTTPCMSLSILNEKQERQASVDLSDEVKQEVQTLNVFSDFYTFRSRGRHCYRVMKSESQRVSKILETPISTLQIEAADSRCLCGRHFSSLPTTSDSGKKEAEITSGYSREESSLFQNMLMTRRTTSNYQPLEDTRKHDELKKLQEAVHRAVACAVQAPNHKRTEPYTFKALFSGSAKRDTLLDLLQRHTTEKAKGDDRAGLQKKQKWCKVPAFIIALCSGQPDQGDEAWVKRELDTEGSRSLEEMPFIAPSTLRQVEDYAATCAAIENMLLSLHAEGYGTKWSTGSLTRTYSFRQLVGAKSDDLVVGLVFAGAPKVFSRRSSKQSSSSSPKGRRLRRDFHGDLFHTL